MICGDIELRLIPFLSDWSNYVDYHALDSMWLVSAGLISGHFILSSTIFENHDSDMHVLRRCLSIYLFETFIHNMCADVIFLAIHYLHITVF